MELYGIRLELIVASDKPVNPEGMVSNLTIGIETVCEHDKLAILSIDVDVAKPTMNDYLNKPLDGSGDFRNN